MAEWLIQLAPVRRRGLRYLTGFPNVRQFRAFDFAISAAGYNSFHELLHQGVPTIFVPNDNQKVDDQRARAAWAESRGAAICLPRGAEAALGGYMAAMLDPSLRRQLSRRARTLCPSNGAAAAAAAIAAVVGARLTAEMATRLGPCPNAQPELARLRELVAEQHRRLRVVRGEAPPSPVVLAGSPMERCVKPRLTAAAVARLLEEARHRVEFLDTAVGMAIWATWPERRPTVPVLRPAPGSPPTRCATSRTCRTWCWRSSSGGPRRSKPPSRGCWPSSRPAIPSSPSS